MTNEIYGRKIIRKKENLNKFQKRLFTSWGVCLTIGCLVGGLLTYCLTDEEPAKDDRVFTQEISMDWSSGAELGFVPLNVPMDKNLQEFVYCLSYGYNIDFPLVMAVINQESSFRTDIVSDTNDVGLMQINKINHQWLNERLGITDFTNPHQNTRAGIFILRKLFEKYEEPSKVLMAYNLGEDGAKKLWNKGIYETDYSRSILAKAAEYEKQVKKNG